MIDDFFLGGGGLFVCLCIVSLLAHFLSMLLNSGVNVSTSGKVYFRKGHKRFPSLHLFNDVKLHPDSLFH